MTDGTAFKVLVLALGFTCGCQPANCTDGGPDDVADLQSTDDAADDAYVSPRRNGMGEGLPDLTGGQQASSPDLAGRPVVDDAVCNDCEKQQCRDVDGNDWYAYCFLNMAPVTTGPGAGKLFSELCLQVLRCARQTGCASADPEACYCGAGVSDVVCLGQPAGPCMAEFEAAAESSHVSDVIDRLSDPSYPVGAAFNLLRYCEGSLCSGSCAGLQVDGGVTLDLSVKPDLAKPADLAHPADLAIPCADLDQDGKPDCNETLLRNARFDSDVSSWAADYGASASWQGAPDALGGSSSGSIAVGNTSVIAATGTSMTGASQCVKAVAGASYRVATQVLIAAGQGTGVAGMAVQFFASSDCSGSAGGAWSSAVIATTGTWSVITGSVAAPAATGSMRVRLVALKPFSAPAFQAQFDNVLVETP